MHVIISCYCSIILFIIINFHSINNYIICIIFALLYVINSSVDIFSCVHLVSIFLIQCEIPARSVAIYTYNIKLYTSICPNCPNIVN